MAATPAMTLILLLRHQGRQAQRGQMAALLEQPGQPSSLTIAQRGAAVRAVIIRSGKARLERCIPYMAAMAAMLLSG